MRPAASPLPASSILSPFRTGAILAPVRYFLFLPVLAVLAFFTACDSELVVSHPWPKHYYRVHVTNPRGELVADWIAVGKVWRTSENTFRFHAVERDTAPPSPQEIHYPDPRLEEVSGANIHVIPCGIPLWIYEQDGR